MAISHGQYDQAPDERQLYGDQTVDETSEEIRQWLNEVESGLRRARMDGLSIDRIMARFRADPRDMVSLLQAREMIPNLRDPPESVPSDAELATAGLLGGSSGSALTISVRFRASGVDEAVWHDSAQDALAASQLMQLQSRLQLRMPTFAELQVGMRIWVAQDANRLQLAKEIWLPEMDRFCGTFGIVVSVLKESTAASPLVLIQHVDVELCRTMEWWYPVECLRLVSVLSSDAMFNATSLAGSAISTRRRDRAASQVHNCLAVSLVVALQPKSVCAHICEPFAWD